MRRLISIMMLLMLMTGAYAQKLTVESMQVAQGDLSARTLERKDLTGQPCGLVKVQLAAAGAQFDGYIIGDVQYKTGEYWVYMTQGSYMLQVKHPNFMPLMVSFRDHGIKGVEQKVTYELKLSMGQVLNEIDDGMRYLIFTVEPKNSMVFVDDKPQTVTNGSATIYLSQGRHTYRVAAPGYASDTGEVMIGNEKVVKKVVLKSVQGTLNVTCPTEGAQVYINDRLYGTTPLNAQLLAGDYLVEIRKESYRPQRLNVSLSDSEQRQLEMPAMIPITSSVNVDYQPVNAEVWIDGKRIGTSPDIFRGILVGQHQVEIRQDGYETRRETVTIAEGQTATLTGVLNAVQSQSASAVSASSPVGVEKITVNGVSFNMVRVEGGTFRMGATKEMKKPASDKKPVHQVTLSSYSIGETEVTQELWEAVMGSNPSNFKGAKLPVESVSWEDCQDFIRKLNALTGRTFRLPTEAEWEFAARGGNKSGGHQYSGSDDLDRVAWYKGNSSSKPHNVGTKQPNELGLYDMSGNVWEWCQDWYSDYGSNAQTNPKGASSGSYRVGRGGSWISSAGFCRSSFRFSNAPSSRYTYLGLRLAL